MKNLGLSTVAGLYPELELLTNILSNEELLKTIAELYESGYFDDQLGVCTEK